MNILRPVRSKGECLGEADVIIVGGGPAGSSTALHLQQMDPKLTARTLVLEKSTHPREKICGGALTINAERMLESLDIALSVPSAPVNHVRLVYGTAHMDLPPDGCAKRVIRRCEFDHLLFKTVQDRGIRTQQNVGVQRVLRFPDHLQLVTEQGFYRAKMVVSADGVHAILRKTPGFGPGRMARIYVAERPADPANEDVFRNQTLLVDLSYVAEGLKGYYWDFPCYIEGRAFISSGIVASGPVGNNEFLEEVLARRGVNLDGALRKAWPIRHFDPRDKFSQPRMLLVGDALGSDPLFSEGISQALAGGRLAAEAIVDGFRRNDLSFATYRKHVLRSRSGRELRGYAKAARILYGPYSLHVLSLLHDNAELRDLIGHSYAGTANLYDNISRLGSMIIGHLMHLRGRNRSLRTAATRRPEGAQLAGAAS